MDNVRKKTHVVSVMNLPRETVADIRDKKDNCPLPRQIRRPRLTKRNKDPQKNRAKEMKALRTKGAKIPCPLEKLLQSVM